MSIEEQIEDFQNWANKKNILLIKGDYHQNKSPYVEVEYNDEKSIYNFQVLAEKLEIKVLVITIISFSSETFSKYESAVNDSEKKNFNTQLQILKRYENQKLGYELFLFKEGACFKFSNWIEEVEEFLSAQNQLIEVAKENEANDKFNSLPKERIEELGKKLAENEIYPKLKNRTQRNNLASEMFSAELDQLNINLYYGLSIIVSHAETLYETVIKPQKEKELKMKISELQKKGWTKVKIAAELKISKDTLNKYG
jgi:hypothetical protein